MPSAMANGQASVDLVIEKRGTPIVEVEARNVESPSTEWAAQFVRNIFAYGEPTRAEYFLLALRNHLYVWRNPRPPVSLPDFEGDTLAALEPYLMRLRRPLEKVSQSGFEMLIQAWLGELVLGILPDSGEQKWLVESGFADAVRDADIRTKIAA
jgi:hypothetical protein